MSGVMRAMAGKVEIKKIPVPEDKAAAFLKELREFLRKSRSPKASKLLKTLEKVQVSQTKDTPERTAFVGHLKK